MPYSIVLLIAFRFARSKSRNKYLSFISVVSMTGMILGVAALVVLTSVLNGFEDAMTARILGMVPHVTIKHNQPINNWEGIAARIVEQEDNVLSAAPFVLTRGMTSVKGEVTPTIINGIRPEYQGQVSILNQSMVAGDINSLRLGERNIVLGQWLVDRLGLEIGDRVSIIIANPDDSVIGMKPTFQAFTLTGVFHVTRELDKWMSYVSMDDASDLMSKPHGAQGIRFRLDNVFEADKTASHLEQYTQGLLQSISINHWKQTHGGLHGTIRVQKTVISLLLFLIILVAAFNITSSSVMLVTEKKSQVAILKTIGASPQAVTRIFITQGLIVSLAGILIGLLVGLGLCWVLEDLSRWVNTTFELNLFEHYFVEALPIKVQLLDILIIVSVAIIIAIVATLYPALKAGKVEAALALKSE